MSEQEKDRGHSLDWYDNKNLFEQMQVISKEVNEITKKLIVLDGKIEKYNGLKDELICVKKELSDAQTSLNTIFTKYDSKKDTHEGFIKWGGWVFGLIGTIVLLTKFFAPLV